MTKPRKELIAFLSKNIDKQFSAKQIANYLSDKSISLSAVYRNLADLELNGRVLRSVQEGSKEAYFQYIDIDSCKGRIHMSCTNCGKTFHMESDIAKKILNEILNTEDFTVCNVKTIFYGICGSCSKT